jgi:hypothetical protein
MTGGRLRRIRRYIDQDQFFATYGDGVSDVDIPSVFQHHVQAKNTATLVGVHLPTTFGIVEADATGKIESFREKPVLPGYINGGFFCFTPEIFDHIEGDSTVLENQPFKALVEKRQDRDGDPFRILARDGPLQGLHHVERPLEAGAGALEGVVTAMRGLFGGVYAGRRVMVTGHTGFKGSWLALWLSEMGAEVAGYSLPAPTDPSHWNLLGPPRRRDRRRHPRCRGAGGRLRRLPARGRVPSRGATPGAGELPDPRRNLLRQRGGFRERVRSLPEGGIRQGRGEHHHRQGLQEPRMGVGLPRERRLRRIRSLQRIEGLRRDRHRELSRQFLAHRLPRDLPPHAPRHRARRQRGGRRRLGGGPTRPGPHARRGARGDRDHPQSRLHPPLAARVGTPERIPPAGAPSPGRRDANSPRAGTWAPPTTGSCR